ncbi:hypothetical protein TrLO_g2253 [Triparma laevis f. longispina]|uniref:Transmembrane protein n=1 Tax=Triparma laevis f. longispina TaxID=1714387 RepID=A0A9W7CEJ1_9STRA|nr:hypothetical protein TrLO_g2253 [Triparma laevis f. longispina]
MASDASRLSWKQVMELRMTKLQFTNGGLFSALSLLASIIFANTNESGAAYDDFLQLLVSLFMLVFVVFDYDFLDFFVKPRFFRGTTTNDDSQRDNSGQFGMHDVSLASGML